MTLMKLLALCFVVTRSSAKFLKQVDPSDALASKLMKKAGFDPNEDFMTKPTHSWNEVRFQDQPKSKASRPSHSRLSTNDLGSSKPMVDIGDLSTPKEWSASESRSEEN